METTTDLLSLMKQDEHTTSVISTDGKDIRVVQQATTEDKTHTKPLPDTPAKTTPAAEEQPIPKEDSVDWLIGTFGGLAPKAIERQNNSSTKPTGSSSQPSTPPTNSRQSLVEARQKDKEVRSTAIVVETPSVRQERPKDQYKDPFAYSYYAGTSSRSRQAAYERLNRKTSRGGFDPTM